MDDPVRLGERPEHLGQEIAKKAEELVGFLVAFEDAFDKCPNKISAVARTAFAWREANAKGDPSHPNVMSSLQNGSLAPVSLLT